MQTKYRRCNRAKNGGSTRICKKTQKKRRSCNKRRCGVPAAASWARWGKWSRCSKKCGGGVQTKYRRCNRAKNGGSTRICKKTQKKRRSCNKRRCDYGRRLPSMPMPEDKERWEMDQKINIPEERKIDQPDTFEQETDMMDQEIDDQPESLERETDDPQSLERDTNDQPDSLEQEIDDQPESPERESDDQPESLERDSND